MGALTIKTYAFQYRSWELESQTITNVFSIFPENLVLYFKNKKLIRILPEFNNEFLTNNIRFSQKKIFVKLAKIHILFWVFLFYFLKSVIFSLYYNIKIFIPLYLNFNMLKNSTCTYSLHHINYFGSLSNLTNSLLQLNCNFEICCKSFYFLNKIQFLNKNTIMNTKIFTSTDNYIKEFMLNNKNNIHIVGIGKCKNFNTLKQHISLKKKKSKVKSFLTLLFFYLNYQINLENNFVLNNSIFSSILWSDLMLKKTSTTVRKMFLFYNANLSDQKSHLLSWSGDFKNIKTTRDVLFA